MARKRKSSDGGISLDSLMDALTNVVAVLILVLVLVQADVSRKVQEFLDDLQPATPEDVAQSKARLVELERKQQLAEASLREKPPSAEDIAEEKRQLALLEVSMEENKELLADLDQVREMEKKVRAERDAESQKTAAIQSEIARLEGLLDTTPVIAADIPTIVNIPNSRPVPDGAKTYFALAAQNRIHLIDPVTPQEIFMRELDRNKQEWLAERIKRNKGGDRVIYDGRKITAHFANFNWGNSRGQQIVVHIPPTAALVRLIIRPDLKAGGTPLEDIGKPDSPFKKALVSLRGDFKNVLLFMVHADSFNAYLAARELTDKANIPAGWDMTLAPEHVVLIPDVEVKRLQEPPPAPPATGPKPKPLKPKLD